MALTIEILVTLDASQHCNITISAVNFINKWW